MDDFELSQDFRDSEVMRARFSGLRRHKSNSEQEHTKTKTPGAAESECATGKKPAGKKGKKLKSRFVLGHKEHHSDHEQPASKPLILDDGESFRTTRAYSAGAVWFDELSAVRRMREKRRQSDLAATAVTDLTKMDNGHQPLERTDQDDQKKRLVRF